MKSLVFILGTEFQTNEHSFYSLYFQQFCSYCFVCLRIIIYPQQFTTRNDVGQSKKVNELDVFVVISQLKDNANKIANSILFSPFLYLIVYNKLIMMVVI